MLRNRIVVSLLVALVAVPAGAASYRPHNPNASLRLEVQSGDDGSVTTLTGTPPPVAGGLPFVYFVDLAWSARTAHLLLRNPSFGEARVRLTVALSGPGRGSQPGTTRTTEAFEIASGAVLHGIGGSGSRQTVTGGSAVHLAAIEVRDKALKVAAHTLEASERDLELKDGEARVKGVPELSMSLADIAKALAGAKGYSLPKEVTPWLQASVNFRPPDVTYANAAHVVEVEVDPGTGGVKILRYSVANDSGRLINPIIAEGQLHGGTVHGIGNALFEWMGYDENAQPVTTTLADYLLPTAAEVPNFDIVHAEIPSTLNPLGVKGIGEAGTVPVAGAVISAIEHALEPFGVRIAEAPISPSRLIELILAGSQKS